MPEHDNATVAILGIEPGAPRGRRHQKPYIQSPEHIGLATHFEIRLQGLGLASALVQELELAHRLAGGSQAIFSRFGEEARQLDM